MKYLNRLILPIIAGVMITACSRSQPPRAMPSPGVIVASPQVATVTNWDEYPGRLDAVESVEIRARVSGYIESIHFTDGAEVKAGDLLVLIDPKPYQADLDRVRADRRRAETQLELARNDLQRAESLRGTKAISDEEFDARSKAARAAEDGLAAVRAAEARSELSLGYTRVTAPVSGRIGRRLVTPGNLVQASDMMPGTVLATLVTMDPIYFYFDADEVAFLGYRKALSAAGNPDRKDAALPCELALAGENGFPHKGRIDFHDNRVSAATATVRMRGIFENRDGALMPGGFARVRLPVEQVASALLIPEAAILSEQTRKFVYVVNADQVVEPRPIQLGRPQGARRVVLSGLKPEDRVVVSGLLMLRPGIKVQVVPPNAPAGPGAAAARP